MTIVEQRGTGTHTQTHTYIHARTREIFWNQRITDRTVQRIKTASGEKYFPLAFIESRSAGWYTVKRVHRIASHCACVPCVRACVSMLVRVKQECVSRKPAKLSDSDAEVIQNRQPAGWLARWMDGWMDGWPAGHRRITFVWNRNGVYSRVECPQTAGRCVCQGCVITRITRRSTAN